MFEVNNYVTKTIRYVAKDESKDPHNKNVEY